MAPMRHTADMRRIIFWWRMNWDTILLWVAVLALAVVVADQLGAIDDTIRHIRIGY